MAGVLAESFNSLGIRVIPMAMASSVDRVRDGLEVRLTDGHVLKLEKILVAAGRRPQIEGMGLAEIGIELDAEGWVRVDERYATSVPGIFTAGDIIGRPSLASTAMEQARVAICHAFGFEFKNETDRFWRTISLLDSRGRMGRAYRGASAQRGSPHMRWAVARLAPTRRPGSPAFRMASSSFLFRVPDKVLLGVHIVGELASELIHIGQFVIQEAGTIDRFIDATFAVPTRSEAYKYGAYDGLQRLARHGG